MPAHFQQAARGKAHDERAVGLGRHALGGVEVPGLGLGGRLGLEAPDHVDGRLLKYTEGLLREGLQRESRVGREGVIGQFAPLDAGQGVAAVIPDFLVQACRPRGNGGGRRAGRRAEPGGG